MRRLLAKHPDGIDGFKEDCGAGLCDDDGSIQEDSPESERPTPPPEVDVIETVEPICDCSYPDLRGSVVSMEFVTSINV